jgi:tRNA1Val (adenine37-N6)-methyltransferase
MAWSICTTETIKVEKGLFQFKQFGVRHDRCAMKIGTDGVLLGAWAFGQTHFSTAALLDIGTGSGVIALQLAQRFLEARITGIELDVEAAQQAAENFLAAPWKERLQAQCGDIRDLKGVSLFDGIASNPPFHAEQVSSGDSLRDQARQEGGLPFSELFATASRLLKPGGLFALISPAQSEGAIRRCAQKEGLSLYRLCRVKGHEAAPVKRLMWEFSKGPVESCIEEELTLEIQRGEYTDAYTKLVAPFYLKI